MKFFIAILFFLLATTAQGASVLWDESVDGALNPSFGDVRDFGTLGNGEYDIRLFDNTSVPKTWTVNMDSGTNMSAIILVNWQGAAGQGALNVTKTSNGASWTTFFDEDDEYTDLLQVGSLLGTGDEYRMTTMNISSGTPNYTVRLRIVPEPTTALLLGLGLVGLGVSVRRTQ